MGRNDLCPRAVCGPFGCQARQPTLNLLGSVARSYTCGLGSRTFSRDITALELIMEAKEFYALLVLHRKGTKTEYAPFKARTVASAFRQSLEKNGISPNMQAQAGLRGKHQIVRIKELF